MPKKSHFFVPDISNPLVCSWPTLYDRPCYSREKVPVIYCGYNYTSVSLLLLLESASLGCGDCKYMLSLLAQWFTRKIKRQSQDDCLYSSSCILTDHVIILTCHLVLCTLVNACIQGWSYDNNFLLRLLLKTDLSQNGHLAAVKLFGQI